MQEQVEQGQGGTSSKQSRAAGMHVQQGVSKVGVGRQVAAAGG
jgi:hypothetical protein